MRVYVRGHIWLVDLEPTLGAEMQKIRPAVIVSSDAVQKLPVKLVVPLTKWQDAFNNNFWHVKVEPDTHNGLTQVDAADVLQMRCVSPKRFVEFVGKMAADKMEQIAAATAAIVEYA